ncbi:MAG: DotH/IcmK family type IV secretion protein [Pseudomonadota bacterium]
MRRTRFSPALFCALFCAMGISVSAAWAQGTVAPPATPPVLEEVATPAVITPPVAPNAPPTAAALATPTAPPPVAPLIAPRTATQSAAPSVSPAQGPSVTATTQATNPSVPEPVPSQISQPVIPPPAIMPTTTNPVAPTNPGMALPTDESALQALESDPAILEQALRQEAYDASVSGLMPLKPDEIRAFLREYSHTQEAVESPVDTPPQPEMGVVTVSLDPGTAPGIVNLAVGHVTTLNIVDVSGQPWPVQDLGWAGNFEILQPESGSHVIRITPNSEFAYGNLSMRLVGLNTPLIMSLKTSKDKVFYRLDVRVPDYGPRATPPIIEAGITTKAGDKTLTSILEGIMPDTAKRMIVDGVDGRTSAYVLNDLIYVRTPYTLLSPAWNASVKSGDGTNVYALEDAPVLLLSDKGKMVRATLREPTETTPSAF